MFHKRLEEFIALQKKRISEEKMKLNLSEGIKEETTKNEPERLVCCKEDINVAEKENIPSNSNTKPPQENDCRMLRYGEFSPNNPKMRVATQPYLGLGEYEQRKQLLLQQRKAEYQQYAAKTKRAIEAERHFLKNTLPASRPVSCSRDKAVQTDIQNIHTRLIQYDTNPLPSIETDKSARGHGVKIDKVQIETQNNIIIPGQARFGDKAILAKANSPRAKLMQDLKSSYLSTLMGYAAVGTEDEERLEKVRRQEKYLAELKQQIEEKQRLVIKHKEQERREQEMDARRIEAELRSMSVDDRQVITGSHAYNTDLQVATRDSESHSLEKTKWNDSKYKSRMLDSSLTHYSDPIENKMVSKSSYTCSPPLSRREKRPPYSFNIPVNSVFATSRKETDSKSLNSTTKYTTKDSHRKSYASPNTFDDSLPIPVLKAQSPVAKELRNAVAVQSKPSEAMRKLEDKWQIPAVQKNIIKASDRSLEGNNNHSILTQLGAIRMQLQQEQLRLDETLRQRDSSQTVVHADVHHNLL